MKNQVSRRNFLKTGAVIGAAAFGAAALGGCASPDPAATTRNGEPKAWDQETDIVIVGFGYAGMGAALSAKDAGLSAIVLEKMPAETAGGASSCNGGNFSPMIPEDLMYNSYNRFEKATAEKICEKATAFGDLVQELPDVEMVQGSAKYGDDFRSVPLGGYVAYNALVKTFDDMEAVTIMYETPAVCLVKDVETGEVLGVEANDAGGNSIFVKARYATILATGGYECNTDLWRDFHGQLISVAGEGGPARTGDGIALGAGAGGRVGNISQCTAIAVDYKKPSDETGNGFRAIKHGTMMWVNHSGKRFMNESSSLGFNKTTRVLNAFASTPASREPGMNDYANLPCWAICDAATLEKGPIGVGGTWKVTWASVHGGYTWSDDNQAEIKAGWILKGDTIEELAAQLKSKDIWGDEVVCDAAALQEQIITYNAACESGVDEQFNKSEKTMNAIATPPFYAIELEIGVPYTTGGLVTNGDSQVLSFGDEPVSRLYAAGDLSQDSYLNVINASGGYARAQIAVEHAAALDPWDGK